MGAKLVLKKRQVGDDVERVQIGRVKRVLDVKLERHRDVLFEHPRDPVVVLDGHHEARRDRRGAVLQAAGVQNVLSKSLGTTNPHNVVRATMAALSLLRERKPKAVPAEAVAEA